MTCLDCKDQIMIRFSFAFFTFRWEQSLFWSLFSLGAIIILVIMFVEVQLHCNLLIQLSGVYQVLLLPQLFMDLDDLHDGSEDEAQNFFIWFSKWAPEGPSVTLSLWLFSPPDVSSSSWEDDRGRGAGGDSGKF